MYHWIFFTISTTFKCFCDFFFWLCGLLMSSWENSGHYLGIFGQLNLFTPFDAFRNFGAEVFTKSWLFGIHSDFFLPGIQNNFMSLCEKNQTKDFILTWWATLLWFKHRDQHVQMQYLHTSLKCPSYWKRSIQIPIFLFGLMCPPLTTRRNAATPPRRTNLTWAELWLWLHNARPDAPPLFDLLTSSLLTDLLNLLLCCFFLSTRWTVGLWGCCCTRWSTVPCRLTGATTRTSFARSATASTKSPPSPQVSERTAKRVVVCHQTWRTFTYILMRK